MKISRINRFFNIVLGALAMLVVALFSAFITMRLAIHGREVKVPNLTGMTLSEASKQTRSLGLILTLENRFYSPNTPPGHILAQSPAPGVPVRRQWAVRVTESLGAQQVAIPDVLGQSERTASINIRRLGLELGAVAHIAAPGEPGVVIAQTPAPNAAGVDRPRVSLLLSEPAQAESPDAFVMPLARRPYPRRRRSTRLRRRPPHRQRRRSQHARSKYSHNPGFYRRALDAWESLHQCHPNRFTSLTDPLPSPSGPSSHKHPRSATAWSKAIPSTSP